MKEQNNNTEINIAFAAETLVSRHEWHFCYCHCSQKHRYPLESRWHNERLADVVIGFHSDASAN